MNNNNNALKCPRCKSFLNEKITNEEAHMLNYWFEMKVKPSNCSNCNQKIDLFFPQQEKEWILGGFSSNYGNPCDVTVTQIGK